MPRPRSPERDRAKQIFLKHRGEILLNEIANQLNLPESTIRGWKSKDSWESELNGTPLPDSKKNTERSKRNTERSDKNKKNSFNYIPGKGTSEKRRKTADSKTNTNTPRSKQQSQQRPDNQNAVGNAGGRGAPIGNDYAMGNAGGLGGPPRNKHAVRTHEFETFYYDELDDEERAFLLLDDCFGDKDYMQILLIKDLTRRERRMEKEIRALRNTPGGMVFDSVTKSKGTLTTGYKNRNADGSERQGDEMVQNTENTSHVAKPILSKILPLEDALTRVQARKQAAINQLHKMQIYNDGEEKNLDAMPDAMVAAITELLNVVKNPVPNRDLPQEGDDEA